MEQQQHTMRKLRTIEMHRLSVEQFREARKLPLIVVLDDVRSLYNVGSVFRSCDAFRVEAVYLCGITVENYPQLTAYLSLGIHNFCVEPAALRRLGGMALFSHCRRGGKRAARSGLHRVLGRTGRGQHTAAMP